MSLLRTVFALTFFTYFSNFLLIAKENHSFYFINGGTLSSQEGYVIPKNTYAQIMKENSWSVTIMVFNQKGILLNNGRPITISKKWFYKASTDLSLEHFVNLLAEGLNIESIQQKYCQESAKQLGPLKKEEIKAGPLPENNMWTFLTKNPNELENFYSCYQKDRSALRDYSLYFRPSITEISEQYAKSSEGINSEQVNAILGCLLYRESSHWKGKESHSGAVGIGQFTGTAINRVKSILTFKSKDTFQARLDSRYKKLREKKLSATKRRQLQRDINIINAEKARYMRFKKLQQYWKQLNLKKRPAARKLNHTYFADKNNHQSIIAMSSLLLLDCQIGFEQAEVKMSPKTALLACAGAYNMGAHGFFKNAINKRTLDQQNLQSWITNLESSHSPQKKETIGHLISIHRCSQKESNFPPCGTNHHYCKNLPLTNPCQSPDSLKCPREKCQ